MLNFFFQTQNVMLQNTVTGICADKWLKERGNKTQVGHLYLSNRHPFSLCFYLLKTPFLAAPAEGFLALPFPFDSSAFLLLAPDVGDGRTLTLCIISSSVGGQLVNGYSFTN